MINSSTVFMQADGGLLYYVLITFVDSKELIKIICKVMQMFTITLYPKPINYP